jgi:hypothetical protein
LDRLAAAELLVHNLKFAKGYYVDPDGSPSQQLHCMKDAMRPFKHLYAATAGRDYPKAKRIDLNFGQLSDPQQPADTTGRPTQLARPAQLALSTQLARPAQLALSRLAGRVALHFPPPYCPDHNRIGRVWRALHDNATRNHTCRPMKQPMIEVNQYLAKHDREPQAAYATRAARSEPAFDNGFCAEGRLEAPLGSQVSRRGKADGEGFEPPVPFGTLVFKTSAFVHSATHPFARQRSPNALPGRRRPNSP